MPNIKRRFKRIRKGNHNGLEIFSFCEDEGLVTSVSYNGTVSFAFIPNVKVSGDDLAILDQGITYAFERLPWRNLADLVKIADFIIDLGLEVAKETAREG